MTPAERNAGMADCSLSGLMQAAMQDQEAAVAEARKAALEEAAQWHDKRRDQMKRAERQAMEFSTAAHFHAQASFHEDSAAAIRALKEQEPTT